MYLPHSLPASLSDNILRLSHISVTPVVLFRKVTTALDFAEAFLMVFKEFGNPGFHIFQLYN